VQTNSEEKLNMQCPKRGLESVRSRASFAGQLALLFMGERWLSFNVLSAWNVLVRYWHENFTHVWRLRRVRRNGVLEGIEQIVQSNFLATRSTYRKSRFQQNPKNSRHE
jgi:hypothetical protein